MFKIEQCADFCRVTGYADGTDWLLVSKHTAIRTCGVAGDHVWYQDDSAALHILHAPERRIVAILGICDPKDARAARVSVSRNGDRLYALVGEANRQVLKVIDPSRGTIVAAHGDFPGGWQLGPLQRPDGKILIPFAFRDDGDAAQGLVLFDPSTGAREKSSQADRSGRLGFGAHSPDGRWWIKPDHTVLPVQDVGPERYYGLMFQLWEAFPLRFVRRLVVAWLKPEEMPDEPHRGPPINPRALWNAIAETTRRVAAGPLDEVPRSSFPTQYSDNDESWRHVELTRSLISARAIISGWQPDGQAFWIRCCVFLSCVGVDGAISARLYTERKGLAAHRFVQMPMAAPFDSMVPLNGRKALVSYSDGVALFDGAPSDTPYLKAQIASSRDQWVPSDGREHHSAWQRVEALKEERKKVFVPLAEWIEAACIASIDALTAQIDVDFIDRAVDGEIQAVFVMGQDPIDEEHFFTTARDRFPNAAPALRRLVDRYISVNTRHAPLFWRGDEGIGVFGHAVRALGVLDHDALSILRRYGHDIDTEHESFFSLQTIPAVIAAHGWSDAVIDFVVWVLLRNFYNTLPDHGEIWNRWGLGDAAKRRYSPEAFAARVAGEVDAIKARIDDPGRYGAAGIDKLAKQLPKPYEPWVQAFFAELERIAGDAATA